LVNAAVPDMRPESAAEHGSNSSFIKSKNSSSADTPNRKVSEIFRPLLVGFYEGKNLKFGGRVGTGFSDKLWRGLYSELEKTRVDTCPFYNLPASGRSRWDQGLTAAEMRRCHWVKPVMVCQIKFTEWTRDDRLRQPVFLGIREDKNANEVVREKAS
jgi:bifunctional non-homologous end joining protein LigD